MRNRLAVGDLNYTFLNIRRVCDNKCKHVNKWSERRAGGRRKKKGELKFSVLSPPSPSSSSAAAAAAAVRLKVDSLKRTCWEGGWTVFSVRAHSCCMNDGTTIMSYIHSLSLPLSLRQLKTRSTPFLS